MIDGAPLPLRSSVFALSLSLSPVVGVIDSHHNQYKALRSTYYISLCILGQHTHVLLYVPVVYSAPDSRGTIAALFVDDSGGKTGECRFRLAWWLSLTAIVCCFTSLTAGLPEGLVILLTALQRHCHDVFSAPFFSELPGGSYVAGSAPDRLL